VVGIHPIKQLFDGDLGRLLEDFPFQIFSAGFVVDGEGELAVGGFGRAPNSRAARQPERIPPVRRLSLFEDRHHAPLSFPRRMVLNRPDGHFGEPGIYYFDVKARSATDGDKGDLSALDLCIDPPF